MSIVLAIGAATLAWFFAAAILFFNPVVDKVYRTEEDHPAVKNLPQVPSTIAKIILAVLAQCILWAGVYVGWQAGIPDDPLMRGLGFSAVIVLVKVVPRDIDRVLLTTYPPKRLTIEFVIGVLLSAAVGFPFAYLL